MVQMIRKKTPALQLSLSLIRVYQLSYKFLRLQSELQSAMNSEFKKLEYVESCISCSLCGLEIKTRLMHSVWSVDKS